MGWLFKFLFKYPALTFEQGDFTFAVSRTTIIGLGVLALVALAALVTYRGISSEGQQPRDRAILTTLRVALVALLLFCLLRPALILKAAVPQQNFLGVLIDDSRSFQIADRDGQPRSGFVSNNLAADRPLLAALSKKFVLRLFRFSSSADRLQAAGDLSYEGSTTRLGGALDRARDELA